MIPTDLEALVRRLVALDTETEWVEFKVSNKDPEKIGESISALANSAAVLHQKWAFLIWGGDDSTHDLRGTEFKPRKARCSGQDLEHYLSTQLIPHVNFSIHEITIDDKLIVIFEIDPARYAPVAYKGQEWIRIGSINKPLRRYPEKERALWRSFENASFETGIAASGVTIQNIGAWLNYQDYFTLAMKESPSLRDAIPHLVAAKILLAEAGDTFSITNLGALLLAKDIRRFETTRRKTMRVVFYSGVSRAAERFMEKEGRRGYASGFQGLIGYLMSVLPHSEEVKKALRTEVPMYPEIAIRELVANALVHQDFEISGAGPMVEIFRDRVEITNPGAPLNDIQRLLDLPARSRNEGLAQLLKRCNICEERGTGIDKTLTSVEVFQLPAPDFQVAGDNMRVILFAPRSFTKMTKTDRMRACYQHAGLLYVSNQIMTNETLRRRFGFSDKNKAMATRVIQDTLAAGLIKPYDPDSASRRHAKYVPFWAQ